MAIYKKTITGLVSTGGKPTYLNITDQVKEIVLESGISNGVCFVISPHTTCTVFFEEFVHDKTPEGKDYIMQDLDNCLEKIIPDQVNEEQYLYPGDKHIEEVRTWGNLDQWLPTNSKEDLYNADAHIKASIFGNSATFEVDEGKLVMSKTGYIYFADFDRNRPRQRKCRVIVMGE